MLPSSCAFSETSKELMKNTRHLLKLFLSAFCVWALSLCIAWACSVYADPAICHEGSQNYGWQTCWDPFTEEYVERFYEYVESDGWAYNWRDADPDEAGTEIGFDEHVCNWTTTLYFTCDGDIGFAEWSEGIGQ
jgi:hypothetical protein